MYIATIHNGGVSTPIHNSRTKLSSGVITKGINVIDSFQFTMSPLNSGFDLIHDYTTLVTVYNDTKKRYDFFGRVLYSEDTMSESGAIEKSVICESYLGFLCDSQQEYVEPRNWTVGGLLQHIVNKHNSQMESYKQFTIGEVTVTDPNDNLYCGIQRENTWEALQSKLIDKLGGEIRFRVEGDVVYLDYLVEIGEKSSTEITLSRNMKSITREKDPSEIVTRLIPLGYKRTEIDEDGNEKESEYRLDITSVNDGKNYIEDEEAVKLYGIRVATVEFDDVTVASTLMKKGETWLKENNRVKISYTATALDLSLIGLDIDDFEVCNYHTLKNPLLGINDTVRIIKQGIDICEEIKSTIDFGDNFVKLSETMKRQSDALKLITADYVTNKKFTDAITLARTSIIQTEENITLEATARMESEKLLSADIEAVGGSVALIVKETTTDGETTKVIDSAAIIAAINGDTSTVKINASKVNIEGDVVTFEDLSGSGKKTEICADYIKTGTINAIKITSSDINGGTIKGTTITGGTISTQGSDTNSITLADGVLAIGECTFKSLSNAGALLVANSKAISISTESNLILGATGNVSVSSANVKISSSEMDISASRVRIRASGANLELWLGSTYYWQFSGTNIKRIRQDDDTVVDEVVTE